MSGLADAPRSTLSPRALWTRRDLVDALATTVQVRVCLRVELVSMRERVRCGGKMVEVVQFPLVRPRACEHFGVVGLSRVRSAQAWTWLVVHLMSGHAVVLWTQRRCALDLEQK